MNHPLLSIPLRHAAAGLLCCLAIVKAQAAPPPSQDLGGAATAAATSPTTCPALLQNTLPRLQDEKPQALCQYAGKVLLIVNTASFCGFTPQYKALEALYAQHREQGLVVLGFPSNDFSQESGSNKTVADFCESTFGVKFPMFVKSSVRGPSANPVFRALVAQGAPAPAWNFSKYLVGRDGRLLQSYPSEVTPDDPKLVRALNAALAVKP